MGRLLTGFFVATAAMLVPVLASPEIRINNWSTRSPHTYTIAAGSAITPLPFSGVTERLCCRSSERSGAVANGDEAGV